MTDDNKIMTDGIIFDVDGTVWDSTPIVEQAWNRALQESGYSVRVTADRLKGLFGLPMDDIIADLLPEASPEERTKFAPLSYKYEHEYLSENGGVVYEGFGEMLRKLYDAGFDLYVVSNCQAGYIELMLDKTGFAPFFKGHLCPADTGLLKADNIRRIADENGLQNALYVGDTLWDESASREAGVVFAHAAYGFGTAKAPDLIIHKPTDLVDQLL